MQPEEIIVVDSDNNQYPLSYFTDATRLVSGYVYINERVARAMLARNQEPEKGVVGTNRRSHGLSVAHYVREIMAGLWVPTTSGIGFNTNGKLTNGAHRLKSILKAAKDDPSVKVLQLVCGGLTDQARLKEDVGRKRTMAQLLGMYGHVNTHVLQSALRLTHCYENVPYRDEASWGRNVTMTIEEQLELTEKTRIEDYMSWGARMRPFMHPHAAIAVMCLAEQHCPQGNPAEFMDMVYHGLNVSASNPAWPLREFLLRNKGAGLTGAQQMALWIKAYNRHLEYQHLPESKRGVFGPRFIAGEKYPRFMTDWQPPAPEGSTDV